jgi:hypothetical protein
MTMAWLAVIYLFAVLFLPNLGAVLNLQYALAAGTVSIGIMARRLSAAKVFKNELTLLSLMGLASVIAVMSQNLRGYNFIWRDMMIFPRLGYYACIILLFAMACRRTVSFSVGRRVIVYSAIVLAAFSIVQYFDVLHLNKILIPLYRENYDVLLGGEENRRVIGTIGNPNYWGMTVAMCLCFFSYSIVTEFRFVDLVLCGLLLVGILFSGSRTALIGTVAGIGGSILIARIIAERRREISITLMVVVVWGAVMLWGYVTQTIYENTNRFSVENTHTWDVRIEYWTRIWADTVSDPVGLIIGRGERKSEELSWGDNGYLRMLRDYGLLGLSLYLALLGVMITRTIRLLAVASVDLAWSGGLLAILLAWIIFSVTADPWFHVRLVPLLLAAYIYVHSVAGNIQNQEEVHSTSRVREGNESNRSRQMATV